MRRPARLAFRLAPRLAGQPVARRAARATVALIAGSTLAACSSSGLPGAGPTTSLPGGTKAPVGCAAVRFMPAEIVDVEFSSRTLGFGLVSPGSGMCPSRLAVSRDGGATWAPMGVRVPGAGDFGPLATMSFSSATSGWIAGSGRVEVTVDGGRSWRRPLARLHVGAVAPDGGSIDALVSRCIPGHLGPRCGYRLVSATEDWRHIRTVLAGLPAELANYGTEQMVALPGSGVAIALGQAGPDVLWIVRGDTVTTVSPCAGGETPDRFARAPDGTIDLLCIGGTTGGAVPKSLSVSHDGVSWRPVSGQAAPSGVLTGMAAPSASAVVLVEKYGLWVSRDGGRHWAKVAGSPFGGNQSLASLSAVSPENGWLLLPGAGLWRTHDLVHWAKV
jgi:photosystem II stability/assembly factor-like uncharacterized protein